MRNKIRAIYGEKTVKNFTELSSSVNVTVHKNHLDTKNITSYAKVCRKTADVENVIAKIAKKSGSLDDATLMHSAILFKNGIIEQLKAGYAVNLFNLGVLYLKVSGSIEGENPTVSVAFSASDELLSEAGAVQVGEAIKEKSESAITGFEERFGYLTDGTCYKGKSVRLTGQRLKIAGENANKIGIFFAAQGANGSYPADESEWLKVTNIGTNTPSLLEFYPPDGVSEGKNYSLILRTASGNGSRVNKTVRETVWSGTVSVKAAE